MANEMLTQLEKNENCATCGTLCAIIAQLTSVTNRMDVKIENLEKSTQDVTMKMKIIVFIAGVICTTIGSSLSDVLKELLTK